MIARRARTSDYYETTPDATFSPGDIWSDLPSFGLLPAPLVRGIVITPACDLANEKTETVSYLPTVPLTDYFVLPPGLRVVVKECAGQLRAAGLDSVLSCSNSGFLPPGLSQLTSAGDRLAEHLANPRLDRKKREASERARAGLSLLRRPWEAQACSLDSQSSSALCQDLMLLFGKEWDSLCEQIITNSYSPFLHFLPSDGQDDEYSGVPRHSLVLFRYPISVHSEVLYRANDVAFPDWKRGIEELQALYPRVATIFEFRPLKRSALRKPFIADLLARYVSFQARLGAPSFGKPKVKQIIADIRKAL